MTKTKLEIALERYYQTFGVNYPLLVADCRSDEDIIHEIAMCIKNKERAKEPEYEDGIVY